MPIPLWLDTLREGSELAYRLRITSPRGARGLRRQYKAARDAALRAAGDMWVEKILPGHFKAGAEQKYRYATRTEKHLRRKRREGKGQDPNVYTGRLRDKMLSMRPSVSVNKGGLTLIWRGLPKYTYITDTYEQVGADRRWSEGLMDWYDQQIASAGDEKTREKFRRAKSGILQWRKDHPQTEGGRFKLVKRPNKPAELTAMNRADADAVSKTFRTIFKARLAEAKGGGGE